jgi:hypothetical protein
VILLYIPSPQGFECALRKVERESSDGRALGNVSSHNGKVYSVRRQSESVFLLRLNDLVARYVVVTADSIDFHGFERFVWPEDADQISSFETVDDAAAYYMKLTGSSKD